MGPRAPRPLSCDDVPGLVRTFVGQGIPPADHDRLRDHVAECADCRALYREGVQTAACIGHERRGEREATERALRHHELKRDVFEAHAPARGRAARLRTLLYPAFLCFLMIQLLGGRPGREGFEVEVLSGVVHARGRPVRGELCATGPDGRARLTVGGNEARLGPETRLLLERPSPPRVRLIRGSLELEGSWRVASTHGVIELEDGRARVHLGPDGLGATNLDGRVRRVDHRGETVVAPGGVSRAR